MIFEDLQKIGKMETRKQDKERHDRERIRVQQIISTPGYKDARNRQRRAQARATRAELLSLRQEVLELRSEVERLRQQNIVNPKREEEKVDLIDYENEKKSSDSQQSSDSDLIFPSVIESGASLVAVVDELCSPQHTKHAFGVDFSIWNILMTGSLAIYHLFTKTGTVRQKENEPFETNKDAPSHVKITLALTLFWLRYYLPQEICGVLFKIHPRTFAKIIRLGIKLLVTVLKKEVYWPEQDEFDKEIDHWNKILPEKLKNCITVIDGTEWRISRPVEWTVQKTMWSGKKKQHALNLLIITLLDGRIIYCSPVARPPHDQAQFNRFNVRDKYLFGRAQNFLL